jgi:predicted small metal-binding protein
MKTRRCGDLVPGCNFVARGESEPEIMKKAAAHAKEAHGIDPVPPELAKSRFGRVG